MAQRFAGGTFTPEDFESTFGLKSVSEDEAYSKGSTTGTKEVAGLGTYMNKDDFNRLRNDDQVWKAYGAIYGKDKMKDKREGNQDGLSINALDALMDKLAAPEAKEEAEPDKELDVPDAMKQLPDQVINSRNTIEDFNNNYESIWKGTESVGEDTAFMKQYSFAGSSELPGSAGLPKQTARATDTAPQDVGDQTHYRNARVRAQRFQNEQAPDAMGMP